MTPVEYMNLVRVQAACDLMRKGNLHMEDKEEGVLVFIPGSVMGGLEGKRGGTPPLLR